eukprot:scaffold6310_cov97-Cylindrotheca_fusiformis.AAC.1
MIVSWDASIQARLSHLLNTGLGIFTCNTSGREPHQAINHPRCTALELVAGVIGHCSECSLQRTSFRASCISSCYMIGKPHRGSKEARIWTKHVDLLLKTVTDG